MRQVASYLPAGWCCSGPSDDPGDAPPSAAPPASLVASARSIAHRPDVQHQSAACRAGVASGYPGDRRAVATMPRDAHQQLKKIIDGVLGIAMIACCFGHRLIPVVVVRATRPAQPRWPTYSLTCACALTTPFPPLTAAISTASSARARRACRRDTSSCCSAW